MDFEFTILKKSLELELAYEDRTMSIFLFLVFGVVTLLILIYNSVDYRQLLIITTLFIGVAVFLIRGKLNSKTASEIIKEHTIGTLSINQDPFEIRDASQNVLIDGDFEGSITMKYDGYYQEVVGTEEDSAIYYGTKNQIIIKDSQREKRFIVHLKDQEDKKKFQKVTELLHSQKNIEVKEFTRGQRTYLGKQLNYKEIQEFKAYKR